MNTESTSITKRLVSIDTLRGFDMLMICGADAFFHQLEGKTNVMWVDAVARQFEHPAWIGFAFYDFIFPLFLFIAGVSIPFSLSKVLNQGVAKKELYKKAFIRMLMLIGFGLLYKNAPFPFFDWEHIRLGSVLGRIGIAGFFTTVLYLNLNSTKRLFVIGGILLFYYACVMFIPVPGYGAGNLTFEGNLIGWIDRTFLPGRLLQGTYDELGSIHSTSGTLPHPDGRLRRRNFKESKLWRHQKVLQAPSHWSDLYCPGSYLEFALPHCQTPME